MFAACPNEVVVLMLMNLSLEELYALRLVSKSTCGLLLSDDEGPYTHPCVRRAHSAEIGQAAYNLQYVPTGYRTPGLCRKAVFESGLAIMFVPRFMITRVLCLLAIERQTTGALTRLDEEFHTEELCLRALLNTRGNALAYVKRKTPELCLAAVRLNGRELEHVPEEMRTTEICEAAWLNDFSAAEFFTEPLVS